MATTSTGRLLTDKQLGEAVLSVTKLSSDETGWQAIARDQDTSTLKAVGNWLSHIVATRDTEFNELTAISVSSLFRGIRELMEGKMPIEGGN